MPATPLTTQEKAAQGEAAESVMPHPDGKPWTTCCGGKGDFECMCFMRKPRFQPSRFTKFINYRIDYIWKEFTGSIQRLIDEKGRFFCIHRKTDDGYHRECAGWAAKFKR